MSKKQKNSKQASSNFAYKEKFDPKWIQKRITKSCIDYSQDFGKYLCDLQNNGRPGFNAMTTTQIRNIFGEVKRIQRSDILENRTDFLLVRPKLAYAEARATAKNPQNRISAFRFVMEKAHNAVFIGEDNEHESTQPTESTLEDSSVATEYGQLTLIATDRNYIEKFQRFVDFFEAILAYHKAFGGKD